MIWGALGQFALGQAFTNASAAGATITATASLIAGSAKGAARVASQMLSAGSTVIEGAATGCAAVVGDTLVVTTVIEAGAASTDAPADQQQAGSGSIGWWGPPRYVEQRRPVNAEVAGEVFTATVIFFPGGVFAGIDEERAVLGEILDLDLDLAA